MASMISRREAIRRAAAVTAASTLTAQTVAQTSQARYENLNAAEARTLEAMVGRLIPSDERGPGAIEAGANRYIDRALGGALSSAREPYRQGLAALEVYARERQGQSFSELEPEQQDLVLAELEANRATGFNPDSESFFALVLEHTLQGTFSDPAYGGNRDFVGWELLGYPGLRLAVGPAQQAMTADTQLTRLSAYDMPMFDTDDAPDDD